jgi:hypothetical protein
MSWTVACFCGRTFSSPHAACPHCGTSLPAETLGPRPVPR